MANNFQIVISAVDRATQTVQRINNSLNRLTQPLVRIKQSMQQFSQAMGLDKVGKAMQGVGRAAGDVAGKVSSIVAPMTAVIGVGSIAGLFALATGWGALGFEVSKTAGTLGMATSDLMSMRGAARLAGVSSEQLTGSLKSVGDTMEDALFGRNQSALMLLNKIGVSIHKTADGSIDAARGFKDIATYIAGIKSAQVQSLVARQFGIEAALPLLRKGAKGIAEYQRQVAEFGGSRTQASIAAAEGFGLKMIYLNMATDGLKTSIGDRLIPVLLPFIERLTSWVAANRDLIATRVTEFVEAFAIWLNRISFNDVLNGMSSFLSRISDTVDALGGWKTAALLAMGVMAGPFLLSIVSFGISLAKLAAVTIPVLIRALGLLRLAMLANPITAILTVIATVAVLIYENWDRLAKWWRRMWGDMSEDAASGQGKIAASTDKLAKGAKGVSDGWSTASGGQGEPLIMPGDGLSNGQGDSPIMSGGGKFNGHGASGDWESSPGSDTRPRGIRNNNPGNLRTWGNTPRVDGFARFETPEAGLSAMIRNLQTQQSKHGLNTIASIIGKWAPASENNTVAYIEAMAKNTGFAPNQKLDLTDKATVAPLVSAIIKHEGNEAGFSKDMVEKAVTRVVVDFKNAPAGTTALASTKGGNMVPVRVNHAMPTLAAG